jgi:hypothetical protein
MAERAHGGLRRKAAIEENEAAAESQPARAPGAAHVLALQSSAGNRAVAALMAGTGRRADTAGVQRQVKLTDRPSLGTIDADFDKRSGVPNFGDPRSMQYADLRRRLLASLDPEARALYVKWVEDKTVHEFKDLDELKTALRAELRSPERMQIWLATRPVRLVRAGKQLDVTSMAAFRLRKLHEDKSIGSFATLDDLHAELTSYASAQLDQMVAGNVPEADLDVAVAMYTRLDASGVNDEAILHKLTWHEFHTRQYAAKGISEEEQASKGLVYSPFRSSLTGAPTTGFDQNFAAIHTMPLNVAWLLACCHHGVKFRLYAPLTHRALYRGQQHKVIGVGGEQEQLSALGREMMALVSTGYYTVTQEPLPLAGAGALQNTRFETTFVLTPTPQAKQATMASLSVADNLTWDQVQQALAARGVTVAADANVDDLGNRFTSDASKLNTARAMRQTNLDQAAAATSLANYQKFLGFAQNKQQQMDALINSWGWPPDPLVAPPVPQVPAANPGAANPVAHVTV